MTVSPWPESMKSSSDCRCDRAISAQPMRRNSSDAATIQAAVRAYVRHYGVKQGIALAAEAIGMGERAARHAYQGTDFAADAMRAACADEARLRLVETQLAELRSAVDAVEQRRTVHAVASGIVAAGPDLDKRQRVGGLWGALVAALRPTTAGQGVKV
jgi:hypothetical protein